MPDSVGTPDYLHCWGAYEQAGLTIIYNSPVDDDALINAILVTKP